MNDLRFTARLAFGSLALGALFAVGCSSSSTDLTGDAGPGDETGGETDITPDGNVDETAETATPDPGFDYSTAPSAAAVRFAVAVADFPAGQNFDICWTQGDPCNSSSGTGWNGPLANTLGVDHFTSPEVTNYFTGPTSGEPLCVRLVQPGTSCDGSARFTLSTGGSVKVTDDLTDNLTGTYNTAFIYGSVAATTSMTLSDKVGGDPTGAASAPTIQLFDGIVNTDLSVAGTSVAYGTEGDVTASSSLSIGGATFDVGIDFTTSYYVGVAFGDPSSTTNALPSFYLCYGDVVIASASAPTPSCQLLSPSGS